MGEAKRKPAKINQEFETAVEAMVAEAKTGTESRKTDRRKTPGDDGGVVKNTTGSGTGTAAKADANHKPTVEKAREAMKTANAAMDVAGRAMEAAGDAFMRLKATRANVRALTVIVGMMATYYPVNMAKMFVKECVDLAQYDELTRMENEGMAQIGAIIGGELYARMVGLFESFQPVETLEISDGGAADGT